MTGRGITRLHKPRFWARKTGTPGQAAKLYPCAARGAAPPSGFALSLGIRRGTPSGRAAKIIRAVFGERSARRENSRRGLPSSCNVPSMLYGPVCPRGVEIRPRLLPTTKTLVRPPPLSLQSLLSFQCRMADARLYRPVNIGSSLRLRSLGSFSCLHAGMVAKEGTASRVPSFGSERPRMALSF